MRESSHLTPVAALPGSVPHLSIAHREEIRHIDARRELIYMARVADEALVEHLKAHNWQVLVTHSASEVARAIKVDKSYAGVVDITHLTPRELGSLEIGLRQPQTAWVLLASPEQLEHVETRRFIHDYCFGYIQSPAAASAVNTLANHAYEMATLCELDAPVETNDDAMVGACEAMQQLFRTIRKVAATNAPVFISGESGTGKELTAMAIHERSLQRKAPFIAINCGAIPHHLLQSELFGYERGAFTGAHQRKIGRVEAAHGGTLFLDEIGDLPLESQASLLRFLQEGKIERLGGRESIPVDARVISATHVDLENAMREGRFRADLYHRLCVLRIAEPPLRERGKDIEILAQHILHKFKTDSTRKIRGFAPSAIEAMHSYSWPGNVRELINRVRRAIVMAESRLICASDLDLDHFATQETITLAQARDVAEKQAIENALLRRHHRLNEAAQDLGISRVTLYRLMGAHGLREITPSEKPFSDEDDLKQD